MSHDDLLGEVCVTVSELHDLLSRKGGCRVFELRHDGKSCGDVELQAWREGESEPKRPRGAEDDVVLPPGPLPLGMVMVHDASDLSHADLLGGKPDPYCQVYYGMEGHMTHVGRTRVISNSTTPSWGKDGVPAMYGFGDAEDGSSEGGALRIDVYDKDIAGKT